MKWGTRGLLALSDRPVCRAPLLAARQLAVDVVGLLALARLARDDRVRQRVVGDARLPAVWHRKTPVVRGLGVVAWRAPLGWSQTSRWAMVPGAQRRPRPRLCRMRRQ